MMIRWLVLLTLPLTTLAGCADDAPSSDSGAAEDTPTDPWGGADHMLLMEATIEPDLDGCRAELGGHYRCATWYLPPGVLVPQGTEYLYVEIDLSRMVNPQDRWRVEIEQTAGRSADMDGENLPGPRPNWTFEFEPYDWDDPNASSSATEFYLQAFGLDPLGVGDTTIAVGTDFDVRMGVLRDPAWMPEQGSGSWTQGLAV